MQCVFDTYTNEWNIELYVCVSRYDDVYIFIREERSLFKNRCVRLNSSLSPLLH